MSAQGNSAVVLPRVNIARCDAELRRRMAAAEPAAQMVLLHMAAGAAEQAIAAVEYGIKAVAAMVEGGASDRTLDPIQALTRPGGIDGRCIGFLEAAGVETVRDLLLATPEQLLEVRNAGRADYERAMVAAAKYLGGVI